MTGSASQKTCVICPVGPFSHGLITEIGNNIVRFYQLQPVIDRSLTQVDFAYNDQRKQYHSTEILEYLAARHAKDACRVIGLVGVDLFIPILTHVYGEAQLGGKACVVSAFRLREELPALNSELKFEERMIKEILHEMGHTYQLLHCKDPACVMHYCRSIRDVDKKLPSFCRYCQILLKDRMKSA